MRLPINNNILAITLLSFKEGLRQKVLYGVVIFALLVMIFSVLVSGLFLREISKVTIDFCLSAVNIGGLLVPFFLAVDLLAKDIERRTIYSILARSISRGEYIVGKFAGLTLLTGTIMGILTCAALIAVWSSKQLYGEVYFRTLSWSAVLIAIGISYLGMMVLIAMVVLWCSVATSSFLATLLTLFTYVIGQTVEDVVRFISVKTPGIEISPVLQKTVHLAQYIFPDLAAFDLKLRAAHGLSIPTGELVFLFFYAMGYTTVILSLSILIFRRRDLA